MKQFLATTSSDNGWFRSMRNPAGMELMIANRCAFLLAYVITCRGRYYEGFNEHGLGLGEAMLGDYKNYGMTEQEYRTAKLFLKKHGFATFRSTSKGTIGKLIDIRVFSIFRTEPNEQINEQVTDAQRTPNGRLTTNKELKKERAKEQGKEPPPDSWKVNKDLAEVDRLIEKECAKQNPDRELVRSWQADRRKLVALKKASILPVISEAIKVPILAVLPKEAPLKDCSREDFLQGTQKMKDAVAAVT